MSSTLDPVDQWERKLDESALTLSQDVTPKRLAEEFGTDDIDGLCNETLGVAIRAGVSVITIEHFREAAAESHPQTTDAESDDSETVTDAETTEMLAEARESDASESDASENSSSDTDTSESDANEVAREDSLPSDSDESAESQKPADSEPSDSDESAESQKPADSEPSESDASAWNPDEAPFAHPDVGGPADEGDGLEKRVAELQTENEALRDRVNDLEHLIDALRRQMKQRTKLLTGEETLSTVEPDEIDDVMTRLSSLEDSVAALRQDTQMVRQDGGNGADTPDGRAKLLRQTLLETARTNDGKAKLDRAAADARLGGGLHRDTVLDAMRRAADGYEAEINGASDLEPVDSVTFRVGSGKNSPSVLLMDLSKATGSELRQNLTETDLRQNLTTKNTETGGS